jgi:preprotein translocase subunit SecY
MNIELARRIAFTIGALLIFILGNHIPVPGLTVPSGLSTGAFRRISIFALNILPYLTAAVIIQLLSMVWGRLRSLERSGEAGRRMIARYTLILTLLIAAFQAFGVVSAYEGIQGLVASPGSFFLFSATASMVGGTFFLVWLTEQITRYGIGNGLALVVSVGILIALPADVATAIELVRQGAISGGAALSSVIFWMAVVAAMVFVETARRNVPVEFAARQLGGRLFPARTSVLPIKINSAGLLIPITVTPWVLYLPLAFAAFVFGSRTPWIAGAYEHLQYAQPLHLVLGSLVLFLLVFVYTANVLDPEHTAEALDKRHGVIPGVEPGEPTADYLDRLVSLTTVVGAVYLVIVSLIPEALVASGVAPHYQISGGSVLIVVCTILDLKMQVRALSLTNSGGARQ